MPNKQYLINEYHSIYENRNFPLEKLKKWQDNGFKIIIPASFFVNDNKNNEHFFQHYLQSQIVENSLFVQVFSQAFLENTDKIITLNLYDSTDKLMSELVNMSPNIKPYIQMDYIKQKITNDCYLGVSGWNEVTDDWHRIDEISFIKMLKSIKNLADLHFVIESVNIVINRESIKPQVKEAYEALPMLLKLETSAEALWKFYLNPNTLWGMTNGFSRQMCQVLEMVLPLITKQVYPDQFNKVLKTGNPLYWKYALAADIYIDLKEFANEMPMASLIYDKDLDFKGYFGRIVFDVDKIADDLCIVKNKNNPAYCELLNQQLDRYLERNKFIVIENTSLDL